MKRKQISFFYFFVNSSTLHGYLFCQSCGALLHCLSNADQQATTEMYVVLIVCFRLSFKIQDHFVLQILQIGVPNNFFCNKMFKTGGQDQGGQGGPGSQGDQGV